ncbi:MAG: DNA polymerase III subunit delta [Coriobacteriia bacterium]|nr:DNA polymerase III subunit delta [Coriobacteriia bacterium]
MSDDANNSPPPLLAAYLLNGDDELKRETLIKRLSDRVTAGGDMMLNHETLTAEEIEDPELFLDALYTAPFIGQYRLVVVMNAEKLAKAVSEALISFLKTPNESTVVALAANKLAANTRLYKAINAYNPRSIIDVSSIKKADIPRWLQDLVKDYHLTINYQAAQALIDRVGTSMSVLNNEVKRLAAWAQAAGINEITTADVIALVPALIEPKPWELADALCQRDAIAALRIYNDMGSTQATTIFLHCVSRLRELLTIMTLINRGMQTSSQIASALKKQDWQIRGSLQAVKRFSEKELTGLLLDAQRVEAALKSGASDEHIMTLWILDVCTGSKSLSLSEGHKYS